MEANVYYAEVSVSILSNIITKIGKMKVDNLVVFTPLDLLSHAMCKFVFNL